MSPKYLYLNSRDSLLRLDVSHLVYFMADGNYTHIISANKVKYTIGMTLAKMQNLLTLTLEEKAKHFVRIGKSHIVNMGYINQIDIPKQMLVLSDTASKDALRKLKDLLTKNKIRLCNDKIRHSHR